MLVAVMNYHHVLLVVLEEIEVNTRVDEHYPVRRVVCLLDHFGFMLIYACAGHNAALIRILSTENVHRRVIHIGEFKQLIIFAVIKRSVSGAVLLGLPVVH